MIKTVKQTKYIASDGTEFIGYTNKKDAEKYEKQLQQRIKDYNKESSMLRIINTPASLQIFKEYSPLALANPMNTQLLEDYYEDCSQLVSDIFREAECPDDLTNIQEVIDMVCYIIDSFGGISVINELYNKFNRNLQGVMKKKKKP